MLWPSRESFLSPLPKAKKINQTSKYARPNPARCWVQPETYWNIQPALLKATHLSPLFLILLFTYLYDDSTRETVTGQNSFCVSAKQTANNRLFPVRYMTTDKWRCRQIALTSTLPNFVLKMLSYTMWTAKLFTQMLSMVCIGPVKSVQRCHRYARSCGFYSGRHHCS